MNPPPAYRSLPDTASAATAASFTPPSPLHLPPVHLAMLLAATPPAVVKPPPAYRSLPDTASADTAAGLNPSPPPIPEPSALQLLPFHLAMLLAMTSPTTVNSPPM